MQLTNACQAFPSEVLHMQRCMKWTVQRKVLDLEVTNMGMVLIIVYVMCSACALVLSQNGVFTRCAYKWAKF